MEKYSTNNLSQTNSNSSSSSNLYNGNKYKYNSIGETVKKINNKIESQYKYESLNEIDESIKEINRTASQEDIQILRSAFQITGKENNEVENNSSIRYMDPFLLPDNEEIVIQNDKELNKKFENLNPITTPTTSILSSNKSFNPKKINWKLQSNSEKYINSLEKKMNKAKVKPKEVVVNILDSKQEEYFNQKVENQNSYVSDEDSSSYFSDSDSMNQPLIRNSSSHTKNSSRRGSKGKISSSLSNKKLIFILTIIGFLFFLLLIYLKNN